jgi:hypothetical protein
MGNEPLATQVATTYAGYQCLSSNTGQNPDTDTTATYWTLLGLRPQGNPSLSMLPYNSS